jgi:heme A synthase
MKWIWVILLVIVGALATYVAVEYLTVSIHSLPSFLPGHELMVHGHKARGHEHKRGAIAAFIALVAFVAAGYLAYRNVRADKVAPVQGSATDSLA